MERIFPWLRLRHVLVAAALAAGGAAFYLLDSGFCLSEWRYLTDRELIAKAIRDNASEMSIDGNEASIDRYLAEHPACCSVNRKPSARMVLDVCLGNNFAEVMVIYRQRNPRDVAAPFYEGYFGVDACAADSKPMYGMSL